MYVPKDVLYVYDPLNKTKNGYAVYIPKMHHSFPFSILFIDLFGSGAHSLQLNNENNILKNNGDIVLMHFIWTPLKLNAYLIIK